MGRGRDRRRVRRAPAAVPGAGAVEWRRPDPQGADVRADEQPGNHGEDDKEYWFYVDSTPTHSYMKCQYKYPQRAFPYEDLVATNGRRSKQEMEYELLDTGIFDEDRYF